MESENRKKESNIKRVQNKIRHGMQKMTVISSYIREIVENRIKS